MEDRRSRPPSSNATSSSIRSLAPQSGRRLREAGDAGTGDETGLDVGASLSDVGDTGPDAGQQAQINTRVLSCPLRYVQERFGPARLDDMLRATGAEPARFGPPYGWVSHETFERVLAGVRDLVESDHEFSEACAYKLKESYGPFALFFRVATVKQAFRVLCSTSHMATRVSRFEMDDLGRGKIRLRYTSTCKESRLMCLSRQAQNRCMPTHWWGVPPPTVVEHRCIAWGDAECCYDLHWKEPVRWPFALAGMAGGAALGGLATFAGAGWPLIPSLGAVGLLAAWLIESRRVARENQLAAQDMSSALQALAETHQDAAAELIELHHRQQSWNRELEKLVAERTATLESVVEQIRGMRQVQHTRVRSLSHDIRSPMTMVVASASLLREELVAQLGSVPCDLAQILDDLREGGQRVQILLEELARVASTDHPVPPGQKETVLVPDLAISLRRRLKALVLGREIRTTVFQTRDAPSRIVVDAVLLDRVLDNLLTNAAKYTDRGSILVELDGIPGHLCMRVSDTGRGITEHRLEAAFTGTTPDASPRLGSSLGMGLSVVVRTLAQLGGRLEVMSRPHHGTTFWLFIPEQPPRASDVVRADPDESIEALASRLVRIRKAL